MYLAAPEMLLKSLPQDLPPFDSLPLNTEAATSLSDLLLARRLTKTISGIRVEAGEWPIVHAHGMRAAWVAAWANLRAPFPLVATLHNIPGNGPLAKAALGFIARRAVQTVCVSRAIAWRVPGEKKGVIPNGIDVARFAKTNRANARREFQFTSDDFAVATAARLSHEKGIDILLRAAAQASDMIFLIAGSGPDEGRLADAAPGNVRFFGRIENVETLFAACDVAVIPSRTEGQGIVALEAMAAGAPVVATRVGGLGEMVRDEENGLVVPSEDPDAILQALVRLRDYPDLRARLGKAGREYVGRHGDIHAMVAALEKVYEAAARSRG